MFEQEEYIKPEKDSSKILILSVYYDNISGTNHLILVMIKQQILVINFHEKTCHDCALNIFFIPCTLEFTESVYEFNMLSCHIFGVSFLIIL